MDVVSLARSIEDFILSSPAPALLEDGEVLFDFANAKYSLSTEHGRCLLHLWSAERNTVRRVIGAELKANSLRLTVQRFGQPKPSKMELLRDRERRSSRAQKLTREQYQRLLERALHRQFPEFKVEQFTNHTDLEKSFGPVYSRGLLRSGRTAWACIGAGCEESQAAIDGALTIGLLWLDHLRERFAAERVIEGLKLFLPKQKSQVARLRAGHLNHSLAKFEVWELDEREEALERKDIFDSGNIATRLTRCTSEDSVRLRFAAATERIRLWVPEVDTAVISSGEMSYRIRGLEFARVRSAYSGNSLDLGDEVVFGVGAHATTLTAENEPLFRDMARRLSESRGGENLPKNPLWRIQPERWLESLVAANVSAIDERLSDSAVYSQVPAFSASDRAMIDVLCATHAGRLAVLELKADEDIHLPMQGLDYWSRVRHHQQRGEFAQFGYFAGAHLSPEPPLLFLVAPALHLHPSTDKILRYMSPDIDCTVIGLDERWRRELRVVFRKRAERKTAPACPKDAY